MTSNPARKMKPGSQPPAQDTCPPAQKRSFATRRDSDASHLARREEMEREIAALFDVYIPDGIRLDEFRNPEGNFRLLMWKFLENHKFYDKEKFINEITERMERFPEGKFIIPFVVSIVAIYEYAQHQDLAIESADMCLKRGNGNFAMVSLFSMFLSKIAHDAANANVPHATLQKMISKTLGILDGFEDGAFAPLRMISEVSPFAESLRPSRSKVGNPRIDIGTLPLPDKEPFMSFLLAFENVCIACRQDPAAINEFCCYFNDLSKGKEDFFLSCVSVLAWSARLKPRENSRVVGEVLAALRSWDLSYLKTLEKGLSMEIDISP